MACYCVAPRACHTALIMAQRKTRQPQGDLPAVSDFLDDVLAIGGAIVDHRIRRRGSLNVSKTVPTIVPVTRQNSASRANGSQIARSEK